MASVQVPIFPLKVCQPAPSYDLGGPTRPNPDFSDNGWGPFLKLTPAAKKEHQCKDSRTCTYIADTTASPVMKCACASRTDAAAVSKDEMAAEDNGEQMFLLPFTPLRLAPVVREVAGGAPGSGIAGAVEKDIQKEEVPALKALPFPAP